MYRLLVATVAGVFIVAVTQVASAAPPPPPQVYSWTGWYIGLNAGGGWGNTNIDNNTTVSNCVAFLPAVCSLLSSSVPTQFDTNPQGFIGGGQIGYNWQINSYVLSVETDFQGSTIKGSQTVSNVRLFFGAPFTVAGTGSQEIDWFGTLRGRLGWLVTDALLVYATGGLAYGHVQTEASFSVNAPPIGFGKTVGSSTLSQSDTRAGWTVGGGLEWMFAPRWSVKAEYLYYDLGTVSFNQLLTAVDTAGPGISVSAIRSDAHYRGNIARAGVNYHF